MINHSALLTDSTWDSAPDVMTVKEVAKLLRLKETTVYGSIRAGFLPAANFGKRCIRISKAALRQAMEKSLSQIAPTAVFSLSGE